MDKALAYGARDSGFDPQHGRLRAFGWRSFLHCLGTFASEDNIYPANHLDSDYRLQSEKYLSGTCREESYSFHKAYNTVICLEDDPFGAQQRSHPLVRK